MEERDICDARATRRSRRPPHRGAVLSARPRGLTPLFAFALVCYLVSPYIGLSSRTVDPRIAEVWPTGGVGFVLLTTVWYAGRRVVCATLAVMVASSP